MGKSAGFILKSKLVLAHFKSLRPNWQNTTFFTCGAECQYLTEPCNGSCPTADDGASLCGNSTCIEPGTWYARNYRECGDRCIYISEQCDVGTNPCLAGYQACGKKELGRCVKTQEIDNYFECGDNCFYKSSWSLYYYVKCGDQCLYRYNIV